MNIHREVLKTKILGTLSTVVIYGTVFYVGFTYFLLPKLTDIVGKVSSMSMVSDVKNNIYRDGNNIHIQLDSVVSYKINLYSDILNTYRTAKSHETITLHLTGMGGSALLQSAITAAIKNSKAKTITSVDGTIISAHAYLMLNSAKVRITNLNGTVLMHRAALGGKEVRMCKDPEFLEKPNSELVCRLEAHAIEKLMKGVYTANEIKRVLDGEDVIITLEDLKERLKSTGRLVE